MPDLVERLHTYTDPAARQHRRGDARAARCPRRMSGAACAARAARRSDRRSAPRGCPCATPRRRPSTSSALPLEARRQGRHGGVADERHRQLGAVARHVARPEERRVRPRRERAGVEPQVQDALTSAAAAPSIETPEASIVPASSTSMSKRAESPTGCPAEGAVETHVGGSRSSRMRPAPVTSSGPGGAMSSALPVSSLAIVSGSLGCPARGRAA